MKTFYVAFRGIYEALRTERNMQVHFILTILALLCSYFLHISALEWCLILVAIIMVWVAELFNTAIEKTIDYISLEKHPQAGLVKDIAAGAVLIAAIGSIVIGCIVFLPKIWMILQL